MSVNQASTSADLLALRARESVRPIVMNLLGRHTCACQILFELFVALR